MIPKNNCKLATVLISIFFMSSLTLAKESPSSAETFTTFATCSNQSYFGGYNAEIRESDSSSKAILVIERFAGPDGDGVQFEKQMIAGIKLDDVRDPIVLEYSFRNFDLLMSTERREDGTYAGELKILEQDGSTTVEELSCRI